MKLLLALITLVLFQRVSAAEALILISRNAAGPITMRGEWLLWPPASEQDGGNRLLSLLSGLDWAASGDELAFGRSGQGYVSAAHRGLVVRGYFARRASVVDRASVALAGRSGLAPADLLLLALDGHSAAVTPTTITDAWPKNALIITEADSWDSVAAIVSRAGGRALIVELAAPGERISRYWMQGAGWPSGLPTHSSWDVPGLLPASDAGQLLLRPEQVRWVANDATNWGGADVWIEFLRTAAPPTLAVFGFLLVIFAGCSIYLISREERANFATSALGALSLVPASILLTGRFRVVGDPGAYALCLLGTLFALILMSLAAGAVVGKTLPKAHGLFSTALVGLIATLASTPLWSLYSNVLGAHPLRVSPEASGALFVYLGSTYAFGRGSVAVWVGRVVSLMLLIWGISLHPWWCDSLWSFLAVPILAVFVGEGLAKKWMFPGAIAFSAFDGAVPHGFTWAPGDLFWKASDADAINIARHAEVLLSPGFWGCLLFGGVAALLVERFFFHQARRCLLRDSRTNSLFQLSGALAAAGILQPLLLEGALFSLVGATIVLLWDASRTL